MRQRTGEGVKKAVTHGAGVATLRQLKKFDVYNKVQEDYVIQTGSGGIVSLISVVTMLMLFLTAFHEYLRVEVVDHIIVDTMSDQQLPIGVNITFPHLRCEEVFVDTVDSRQESHSDVHGTMQKTVINADWSIGKPPEAGACGSCMDAQEYDEKRCCNTCVELKEAYSEAGIPYFHVLDTAPQCKDAVGCRIHGDVLVAKVSGNFHVALGKSTVSNGHLIHEFNMKDLAGGFNTSHYIHRISFGERKQGIDSMLEGTAKIVGEGAYMFHYYIKLVPTVYTASDGSFIYTHQYSVTDKSKNVMPRKGVLEGLPGVFFVYHFTPFMVQKIEKVQPLSQFLVSICAIIGGVYTVASMIDSLLYKSYKSLKQVPNY